MYKSPSSLLKPERKHFTFFVVTFLVSRTQSVQVPSVGPRKEDGVFMESIGFLERGRSEGSDASFYEGLNGTVGNLNSGYLIIEIL